MALSIGLSACDVFDPIPVIPGQGWFYIQAFDVPDGEPLCTLLPEVTPSGKLLFIKPIALVDQVNPCVLATDNEVLLDLKYQGETKKVWIESTIHNWTLETTQGHYVNLTFVDPAFGYQRIDNVASDLRVEYTEYKLVGYPQPLQKATVIWDERELFEMEWNPGNVFDLSPVWWTSLPAMQFTMPTFSGYVTITRLDPTFGGEFIIHVQAVGAPDGMMKYTGFKVNFGEIEGM